MVQLPFPPAINRVIADARVVKSSGVFAFAAALSHNLPGHPMFSLTARFKSKERQT